MALSAQIADPNDYHALHGILQICGEHMHRVQSMSHWYPFRGFDKFEQEVQGAFVYKVLDEGSLVGTFYLHPIARPYYTPDRWQNPNDTGLYLGGVGVMPFIQGRGVGRWLMDEVDRITQEKGYDALRFDGVKANEGLLTFYDKLGYSRRGEIGLGTMRAHNPVICYEKVFSE